MPQNRKATRSGENWREDNLLEPRLAEVAACS